MRERPILFAAPMVRAILSGAKTQTRRVVKPQPPAGQQWHGFTTHSTRRADEGKAVWATGDGPLMLDAHRVRCPFGDPGDRLWVRESWGVGSRPDPWGGYDGIEYRADEAWLVEGDDLPCHKVAPPDDVCLCDYRRGWHPSIHMPRWASRITLEIVGVRVERLQRISEADARAEGITDGGCLSCGESEPCGCADPCPDARDAFAHLWHSINGTEGASSWHANPWVWVIDFQRVENSNG